MTYLLLGLFPRILDSGRLLVGLGLRSRLFLVSLALLLLRRRLAQGVGLGLVSLSLGGLAGLQVCFDFLGPSRRVGFHPLLGLGVPLRPLGEVLFLQGLFLLAEFLRRAKRVAKYKGRPCC